MTLACLFIVSLLPILYFSDFTQTKQKDEEKQVLAIGEKREDLMDQDEKNKEATEKEEAVTVSAAEAEIQQSTDEENSSQTVMKGIREKVREVIKGTINLFEKDLRIVSIGDSLTEGIGDETESGGYVGILKHTFEDNQLNINIENYGKKGNRTDQMLKRLDQKDIASSIKKADIILITIGANDIMKVAKDNFMNLTMEPFDKEIVEYQNRLRANFHKMRELNPNAHIYLVGFYNPLQQYFGYIEGLDIIVANWNEAGKAVTEEFEHVSYIPIADLFVPSDTELLAEDQFHPNTSGYKQMAQRILEEIDEIEMETEIMITNN